jgi:diaminohydroxyphosphoribosylaminopyrimidine deaminase/5-amino-6-(5-phosphoribosylamino)uracil reductase
MNPSGDERFQRCAVTELSALEHALALAWRGWGRVQPNPMVGAVVLRDGEQVAEGWHAEFGGEHAEAVALRAAGDRAKGATLAVTLEPCRHHGKQPPCTDLIRQAGVRRVVIGLPDPNPLAAGGAAELRAGGVEVTLASFTAVSRQNAIFFHQFNHPDRPFVALKLATSVDGAIADRAGRCRWISGPEARAFVHWLRAGFDAIAVGGRTARRDDPALTVRGEVTPRVPPRRLVFSRSGDLRGATQLLDPTQPPLLVVGDAAGDARVALQRAGAEVIPAETLAEGLRALRRRGVLSLLVEGGGQLAGRLLAAQLVDRFYWIHSPLWLGPGSVPAFGDLPSQGLEDAERWAVAERRALGDDTLLVLESRACSAAS